MEALLRRLFSKLLKIRGQALVEYGLLIGLVVLVLAIALTTLGQKLAGFFRYLTDLLSGLI